MISRKLTLVVSILFLAQTLRAQVVVVQGITPLPTPYTTIQAAFNSLPTTSTNDYTILIASNYDSNNEATTGVILSNKTFNSLTIRPASSVTATINFNKTLSTSFITLSSISKVTIDGRISTSNNIPRFSFNPTSTSSKSITIKTNATNNIIQYCTFNCNNSTTTSGLINIEDGSNNNNIIRNNKFTGNILNIAIRYVNTAGSADNTQILNNAFNHIQKSAIYAANTGNGINSWTIKGNSFYDTTNTNITDSIKLVYLIKAKAATIDSNFFGGSQKDCGGSTAYTLAMTNNSIFRAVALENSISGTPSIITNNRFNNFSFSSINASINRIDLVYVDGQGSFNIGQTGSPNTFGIIPVASKIAFNNNNNSKVSCITNNASGTSNIVNNIIDNITFANTYLSLIANESNAGVTTISGNSLVSSKGLSFNGGSGNSLLLSLVTHKSNSDVTIKGNTTNGEISAKGPCILYNLPVSRKVLITDNIYNSAIQQSNLQMTFIQVNSTGDVSIQSNEIKSLVIKNSTYKAIQILNANTLNMKDNILGSNSLSFTGTGFTLIEANANNTTNPSALVTNNKIYNIIALNGVKEDTLFSLLTNAKVDSNTINSMESTMGMIAFYATQGVEISKNKISGFGVGAGLQRAVLMDYSNASNQTVNIHDNIFFDMNHNSTTGDLMGIELRMNKPCTSISITNNLIVMQRITGHYMGGISLSSSSASGSSVKILFNTLYLTQSATNLSASSFGVLVKNNINTTVKNNIIQNTCSSTATNLVEDYSLCQGSVLTDYNYLYTNDINQYALAKGVSTVASLAKWLETSVNSTGGLPLSIDNAGIISTYFDGAGKAEPVSGITTDRLGAARSNTAPWMGCYEGYQTYVPNLSPTGYCIGGKLAIKPQIAGLYPTIPPTTFTVELSNSGGTFGTGTTILGTFTNTTSIPSSIVYDIPTTITASTQYKIRIQSTLPTGSNEVNVATPGLISISASPSLTLSSTNDQVCTNNNISFNLPPNLSYAWTRNVVTGVNSLKLKDSLFSAPAPGPIFKDSLWLDATTNSATVTYTITPYSNGCKGTSANFNRTVIRKVFTPASLPDGYVGQAYPTQQILLEGLVVPISLYSGTLPSGLTTNAATNTIQGTPNTRGTYSFTLRAGGGTSCISQKDYTIVIRELFSPNLDFTPILVSKSYGDDPFVIPINSRSNGAITFSIETNTAASIDATSGKVTILNALPTITSSVWVYASQAATALYAAGRDSVRLFISKAKPRLQLVSGNTYSLGNPDKLIYTISKNYPSGTAPTEPIQSDQPTVALVSVDADSIYPYALGTFNVLFSFPATTNHFAFDTVIAFKVIELPIPPVAVNDTIIVIRNPDKTFQVDTINILSNDTSKTGLIVTKLTDIDETNIGSQYLYYKPSIGTFQYDTLNGNLIMNPYSGLQGTTYINYTLTDEDGLSSVPARIIIIVDDQSETPPLLANEVMTPNGDGNNDALVIGYTDVSQPNSIIIFDVAGNTLYESDHYQNDWNGKDKNGKDLESGIYFYVYKEKTGSQRELTGYVKITR